MHWLLYTWDPLHRSLGGPQDWSGWVQNVSPLLGFDHWTVQPVSVRCTDRILVNKVLKGR